MQDAIAANLGHELVNYFIEPTEIRNTFKAHFKGEAGKYRRAAEFAYMQGDNLHYTALEAKAEHVLDHRRAVDPLLSLNKDILRFHELARIRDAVGLDVLEDAQNSDLGLSHGARTLTNVRYDGGLTPNINVVSTLVEKFYGGFRRDGSRKSNSRIRIAKSGTSP